MFAWNSFFFFLKKVWNSFKSLILDHINIPRFKRLGEVTLTYMESQTCDFPLAN